MAPELTARWTVRQFLTPRTRPPSRREQAVLNVARRSDVTFRGRRLAVYEWSGVGPTVLMVHGWNGHAGQLAIVAQALHVRGCRVVAFDAPGHGRSEPAITHVPEMAEAVAEVARTFGGIHAVVAHSMGCIAAAHAMGDGLGCERMVLLAPARRVTPWAKGFAALAGMDRPMTERFLQRLDRWVGVPVAEVDLARVAADVRCPALVIHDPGDAWSGGALAPAFARLPRARIRTAEGAGHFRILEEPAVVRAVARYVTAVGDQGASEAAAITTCASSAPETSCRK